MGVIMQKMSRSFLLLQAIQAAGIPANGVGPAHGYRTGPPWRVDFPPGVGTDQEKQQAQQIVDSFVFPTEEEYQRQRNRLDAKWLLRGTAPEDVLRRAGYAAIGEQLNPGLTLAQILATIESKINSGVAD